jgi:hypothetical protein
MPVDDGRTLDLAALRDECLGSVCDLALAERFHSKSAPGTILCAGDAHFDHSGPFSIFAGFRFAGSP